MRSSASATAGEVPQRPFTSRDIVFRLTPKRSAHSVTVQPSAAMLSRTLTPGCEGFVILILPALRFAQGPSYPKFLSRSRAILRSSSVKSDCQRSCRTSASAEMPSSPRFQSLVNPYCCSDAFRSRLAAPTPPCVSIICRKYVGRYPCSVARRQVSRIASSNSASSFSPMYHSRFSLAYLPSAFASCPPCSCMYW